MAMTGGKKVCLWFIILGILALLTASASPFWLKQDVLTPRTNFGLWYKCADGCETYPWTSAGFSDFTSIFYALHVTSGLATLITIVVLFVSIGKLCSEGDATTGLGVWTLIAGFLGIAAAVIFYLKDEDQSLSRFVTAGNIDWAFYCFSAGSGTISLFSCILLCLPSEGNQVQPYY